MHLITQITNQVLALLSLAVFAWLGWQGYLFLVKGQFLLQAETQAVLLLGAVVLLVGTYMIASAIRKGKEAKLVTSRKVEVFEQYLRRWLHKSQLVVEESETEESIGLLLSLLAQNYTLNSIKKLEKLTRSEGYESDKTTAAFKELVIAMRRDLGLSTHLTTRKDLDQLLQQ